MVGDGGRWRTLLAALLPLSVIASSTATDASHPHPHAQASSGSASSTATDSLCTPSASSATQHASAQHAGLAGGPCTRLVHEGGVALHVGVSLALAPGASSGFYNPKMATRRAICVCELGAALASGPWSGDASGGLGDASCPARVLDGFAGAGALALQWALSLPSASRAVELIAADADEACCDLIRRNAQLNRVPSYCARGGALAAAGGSAPLGTSARSTSPHGTPSSAVALGVACADVRALLLLSPPFEYVALDPFGSCAPYLDAVASRAT